MNNLEDSITLAGKSYTIDAIVHEENDYIRLQAVDCSFALKELVTDNSLMIRTAVARKNVGHHHLIKDKNWTIRATVAQYCTDKAVIDQLITDENDYVRFIMAKRGLGSAVLVHDSDVEIASIARKHLKKKLAI